MGKYLEGFESESEFAESGFVVGGVGVFVKDETEIEHESITSEFGVLDANWKSHELVAKGIAKRSHSIK